MESNRTMIMSHLSSKPFCFNHNKARVLIKAYRVWPPPLLSHPTCTPLLAVNFQCSQPFHSSPLYFPNIPDSLPYFRFLLKILRPFLTTLFKIASNSPPSPKTHFPAYPCFTFLHSICRDVLHYSCPEKSMDRGWWAQVHRISEFNRTELACRRAAYLGVSQVYSVKEPTCSAGDRDCKFHP